jgi:hypothetical protein
MSSCANPAAIKKHGYLAMALRLGHYLIWHVVYGSLIYPGLR